MNEPDGFFQVVAEADFHRFIGTQIIGADASSLIAEASIAMHNRLSLGAIAYSPQPYTSQVTEAGNRGSRPGNPRCQSPNIEKVWKKGGI